MATTKKKVIKSTKTEEAGAGADLLAPLDNYGKESVAVAAFWLGVVPQCATPFIRCGGISFPKMNELLVSNPNQQSGKARIPVIGGLHGSITQEMIDNIKEHMKRLVIRFDEAPRPCDRIVSHQGIEALSAFEPRKGRIVTIPRKRDIEMTREEGRIIRPYVRQQFDEPAAKYMFMQPCVDQDRPQRGGFYPACIPETGLDMSVFDDLEELLD